ncbi:MAG: ferrous iron transport protein B [Clostridium sp.]
MNLKDDAKMKEVIEKSKKFRAENDENIRDTIVESIYEKAEDITKKTVVKDTERLLSQQKIDDIITSKRTGIPIMLLMLAVVFWLTIQGANYPSEFLAKYLFWIEAKLGLLFSYIQVPLWLNNLLVLGVYRTFAWVVSVMLPPMAIFFPIFTLLEDVGYLPRMF